MLKPDSKIEVRVSPHTDAGNFYVIEYREVYTWPFVKPWIRMMKCWDGYYLNMDMPVLISNFDSAVEYAKKLKENPMLIEEHNVTQQAKYEASLKKREELRKERNKSIII